MPGTYRYFIRGRSYKPTSEEYLVPLGRKKKMKEYDKCLKKFQYKKALDAALNVSMDITVDSSVPPLSPLPH